MKPTALYFDERTLWHVPGGLHALYLPVGGWIQPMAGSGMAESPDSKRRIKSLLDASGLSAHLDVRSAPPATREDLLRVHVPHYLDEFKRLSDAGGGILGDTAPFGAGSYEIACLSTGLAVAALDSVLRGEHRNAFALTRPPGHHCLPDRGMGFCLFNNIAVAIEAAKARHRVERVAVIDWDVHHGNGTQQIFYERADVLTLSLHQEGCFPPGYSGADDRGAGAGLGCNVNIPLLPGGGHESYLYAFERIVVPVIDRYKPELIVVASGLDANGVDPLARMQLHPESFRAMARTVLQLAARHAQQRLVVVHEGGYSEVCVPFCALAVVEELCGRRTEVPDPFSEFFTLQQPSQRFMALQRQLIDEMAALHGLA
ncbi:MAG: Histone deacetylase-like amidohydrolase [Burkholderiaceae bacterium]|nr:Histone deacetylase-like amidohydrolase [Burkholderiaceae bacterium]